jgi:hypothetical protein
MDPHFLAGSFRRHKKIGHDSSAFTLETQNSEY